MGGDFTEASGNPAEYIAEWDGEQWYELGGGLNGPVQAMTAPIPQPPPDPDDPWLYVGGEFTEAGGTGVSNIAAWDGDEWDSMAGGTNDEVMAISQPIPPSPKLYAGGLFTSAGGEEANHVASWDGEAWAPLGDGTDGPVYCMLHTEVFGLPRLFVGGLFSWAGQLPAENLALWTGSQWAVPETGTDGPVYALSTMDEDGDGPLEPVLLVGGEYAMAGDQEAHNLAHWDVSNLRLENDECADAITLGPGEYTFTTFGATTDGPDEPELCDFYGYTQVESDIWFRYQVHGCAEQVTIRLCDSLYDTKLAVYEGGCPRSGPDDLIACNDDDCGGTVGSEVTFAAIGGDAMAYIDYRIRIGGYLGEQGDGVIAIFADSLPDDVDGDLDVDLIDYYAFQGCMQGPDGGISPPWFCPSCLDFDDDDDVDLQDAAAFQRYFLP